jgi:hypothetical protein
MRFRRLHWKLRLAGQTEIAQLCYNFRWQLTLLPAAGFCTYPWGWGAVLRFTP